MTVIDTAEMDDRIVAATRAIEAGLAAVLLGKAAQVRLARLHSWPVNTCC